MEQALSVTTLSSYLKQILDNDGLLYRVKVLGEISSINFSNNIAYFGLKDENALLNCVAFEGRILRDFKIGDKVIVQGSPNYYIKAGRLSFSVENVTLFGEGENYKQFLLLKQKLEREGLFDLDRKKPFPKHINKIGVVTSETGAVIQDIINITRRRNGQVDLVLFPVKVQGLLAENSIVRGINYFSNSNVDAIIVARGGGSEEDLAPFNTEMVARALSSCTKFTVSAVGHETNYTLVDFVADLRAPTPSAAAELLVKEEVQYFDKFKTMFDKLNVLIDSRFSQYENKIASNLLGLNNNIKRTVESKENKLQLMVKDLNGCNPLEILAKGYSKIELDGKRVVSCGQVEVGQTIRCNLLDGSLIAQVKEKIGKWILTKN